MSDVSLLAIAGAATANFPATVFIGSGGQAGNIEREYIYINPVSSSVINVLR